MANQSSSFFVHFGKNSISSKAKKTRFLPKTRFQKSKNSILGHKLASKTPQILPFPGKSCLQKVRKTNFAPKINEKHKITSKFEPKAQKLVLKVQKLDLKVQKLDLEAQKLDFSAFQLSAVCWICAQKKSLREKNSSSFWPKNSRYRRIF